VTFDGLCSCCGPSTACIWLPLRFDDPSGQFQMLELRCDCSTCGVAPEDTVEGVTHCSPRHGWPRRDAVSGCLWNSGRRAAHLSLERCTAGLRCGGGNSGVARQLLADVLTSSRLPLSCRAVGKARVQMNRVRT
jgi:hypothetical protein